MNRITLIAAMDRGGVIGREGKIPWKLKTDLRRFKQETLGKSIVMGRKTYDSIGKALPDRGNFVFSRDPGFNPTDAVVIRDLSEIDWGSMTSEVMVIGGMQIYEMFMPKASRALLTIVRCRVLGDAFFPVHGLRGGKWNLASSETFHADAANEYDFTFEDWTRKDPQ